MRSRLSIYLNSLTLDEILYLEEEINRRKERYSRHYAVLSVQSEHPILQQGKVNLGQLAKDMRRFINESGSVGGGTPLAYAPEVSILLFTTVEGASRTCSALLSGLPELNGRGGDKPYNIGLKLGLAAGEDTLAPGSPRCIRNSPLVRRANQCAWRSTAGTLFMDDNAYQEWPHRHAVVRVPMEVDGLHIFRAIPGNLSGGTDPMDDEKLDIFLTELLQSGLSTLKYAIEREENTDVQAGAWSKPLATTVLRLECYDPRANKNRIFLERVAAVDFSNRIEAVKRKLSFFGLAMVRHDESVRQL